MLFSSYLFLFAFLPIVVIGYYVLSRRGKRVSLLWLVVSSLLFLGWSNPVFVVFIASSVLVNYIVGARLLRKFRDSPTKNKAILWSGITANILFLGYFKYTNFFIESANNVFGSGFPAQDILLPVGISFYTIQQIAYLVDSFRDELGDYSFLEYSVFIAFFPKLLSGPIMRFKDMMPEILSGNRLHFNINDFSVGLTSLALGLFKKIVLAEQLKSIADPVFSTAAAGGQVGFVDGWTGSLAYTYQLYFDFSGYCDIALGISLILGIRLSLNFFSPYKSASIIDFWRRWHITLGDFIREYLYIPLGGNRKGFPRQMLNVITAMTIIGFWHGAGLTFIVWGALHGVYLAVNHGWRRLSNSIGIQTQDNGYAKIIFVLITFLAVTAGWVFFRADSISSAMAVFEGMIGLNGISPPDFYFQIQGIINGFISNGITLGGLPGEFDTSIFWLLLSIIICWWFPNVQEYLSDYRPALGDAPVPVAKPRLSLFRWKPTKRQALMIGILVFIIVLRSTQVSNFIYRNF